MRGVIGKRDRQDGRREDRQKIPGPRHARLLSCLLPHLFAKVGNRAVAGMKKRREQPHKDQVGGDEAGDHRHHHSRPARKGQRVDPDHVKPDEGFVEAVEGSGAKKHQNEHRNAAGGPRAMRQLPSRPADPHPPAPPCQRRQPPEMRHHDRKDLDLAKPSRGAAQRHAGNGHSNIGDANRRQARRIIRCRVGKGEHREHQQ